MSADNGGITSLLALTKHGFVRVRVLNHWEVHSLRAGQRRHMETHSFRASLSFSLSSSVSVFHFLTRFLVLF